MTGKKSECGGEAPCVAPGPSHPVFTQLTVRIGHMLALRHSFRNIFEVVPERAMRAHHGCPAYYTSLVSSTPKILFGEQYISWNKKIKQLFFPQSYYLSHNILLLLYLLVQLLFELQFYSHSSLPYLHLSLFSLILLICGQCSC